MAMAMYKLGSDKCQAHGGSTPRGIASPNYKPGGRYSKFLPVRMIDNYKAAMENKELLDLRDQICTIEARILDVLQRVDTGEAGVLWSQAYKAYNDMATAMALGKQDAIENSLVVLRGILGRGQSDWASWGEVKDLMRLRKELGESEQKRLMNMKIYLSSADAINLICSMAEAVRRHVYDIPTLSKIQNDFIKLSNKAGVMPSWEEGE